MRHTYVPLATFPSRSQASLDSLYRKSYFMYDIPTEDSDESAAARLVLWPGGYGASARFLPARRCGFSAVLGRRKLRVFAVKNRGFETAAKPRNEASVLRAA